MFTKSIDLRIVQRAETISDKLASLIPSWDLFTRNTIGQQLQRAVDSICANIVEGYGRHHSLDSLKFYYVARGSLEETHFWIRRAMSRNALSYQQGSIFLEELEVLSKMLNSFISTHKSRSRPSK